MDFRMILIILCGFISCSETRKPSLDCEALDRIVQRDQGLRNDKRINFVLHIADSLKRLDTINNYSVESYSQKAFQIAKDYNFNHLKNNVYHQLIDSINAIDSTNTVMLIDIIKFSTDKEIDTSVCLDKTLFIFAHSPKSLHDEIRKLITNKKNVISNGSYSYIMWDLNNRLGEISDYAK